MVTDWRNQWHNNELPFYSVQIAPYGKGVLNGYFIREAQLKSLTSIPNFGLVVTLDLGKEDKIHPPDKAKVAERLSLLALVNTYKWSKQETSGPILKKTEINNGIAILTFEHCSKVSMADSTSQLKYFQIAGEDKKFYDAVAEIISPNQIKVSHLMVDKPIGVRYDFADWTLASLYNSDGLPASSFRTDNWEK
jgi:sialate O-acetylesterase